MAGPWHTGRGGGRVSETLGEFTFSCCLPNNPHSSNRAMLIQSIRGTWWPAEQLCSCVWGAFFKISCLRLYQLNYTSISTCQGFTGTFLWAWLGSSMSPVLPEQQTGVATPPRCNSGSWDMGQGFSYPCQADLCEHPAIAVPPGLVAQDPLLHFQVLQHFERPWQILVASLVAFKGCPISPKESVSPVCCCVCTLQRGTEQGDVSLFPGWVLCLAVQESQGMCQAATCTGGTAVLEKGEWSSTNGICTMHLLLWKLWEALTGVILLGVFFVCIPQSWVHLLLWLKLHQAQRKRKVNK